MEKERRLNPESEPPKIPEGEAAEDYETEAERDARIKALNEDKKKYLGDTMEENAIREILAAPVQKPEAAPNKGSLLEWAKNLEAQGNIAERVDSQMASDRAAVDATGRLADLVVKDNANLVSNFQTDDKQQRFEESKGGERRPHAERVVHSLEKAGLHRDPQRESTLAEVRAAFAVFDADSDGLITKEEFRQAMTNKKGGRPVTEEKADELFVAADANGNGTVEYEEFVQAWIKEGLRPPGWVNPCVAE